MNAISWERIGAIAGVLFFIAVVGNFFTPSTPDVDAAASEVIREVSADRTGHIFSVLLNGLGAAFFFLFAGGLWSVLRRGGAEAAAVVTAVAAGAVAVLVLVASGVYLALVYAAESGREGAVDALFGLDNTIFVPLAFPLAAFHAAAAIGIITTAVLPRWLGWASAVIALAFLVGVLGMFDAAHDGGDIGIVFFIGLLAAFLWALATSIYMWLRAEGTGERVQVSREPRVHADATEPS